MQPLRLRGTRSLRAAGDYNGLVSASDEKEVVGLEINSGALVAALVRDGFPVTMARRPLPSGVVEAGRLVDARRLGAEVKAMWRDEGLPTKAVRLGVPNQLALTRMMRLPDPGSRTDLVNAIRLNGREVFDSIDLDNSALSVQELDRDGALVTVSVTAVEKNEITPFVKALERAGLSVQGAETSAGAQIRAMAAPIDPLEVSLVISVGPDATSVSLVERGGISFLRTVPIGLSGLAVAIAAGGYTPEQAYHLLMQVGFQAQVPAGMDPAVVSDVQNRVLDPFDQLVQQVDDTITFARQNRPGPIGRTMVAGEGADVPGLPGAVIGYTPVAPLLPLRGLEMFDNVPDLATYATALALSATPGPDLLDAPKTARRATAADSERREDARIGRNGKTRASSGLGRRRGKTRSIPKPYLIGIVASTLAILAMVYGGRWLQGQTEKLQTEAASIAPTATTAPDELSAGAVKSMAAARFDLEAPLAQVQKSLASVPGLIVARVGFQDGTLAVDLSGPQSTGKAFFASLTQAGLQAETGPASAGITHVLIRPKEAS